MSEKRIAVVGATGFTGSELVRLLVRHPKVEIAAITSESKAGSRFSDVHPFFAGIVDKQLEPAASLAGREIDLAFLALPHGVSMDFVRAFEKEPFPIIDLSGDFRLPSPEVYTQWYQKEHHYPEGFSHAVYGIPELFKEQIKNARLVANPGCYPTGAILGIAPLLHQNLIAPHPIIVDSKSGVTGAGVQAKPVNHFAAVNDNFKAYALKTHRHTIEIQGILDQISGQLTTVQFTPHLLPVDRGILATIYTRPRETLTDGDLRKTYEAFYRGAPFVRFRDVPPSIKDVRGTNYCDVFATLDPRTGLILTISVIDNLMKGAAGQAVQNMNLLFGWDETEGLDQVPLSP